jgi:hypothetical protein
MQLLAGQCFETPEPPEANIQIVRAGEDQASLPV